MTNWHLERSHPWVSRKELAPVRVAQPIFPWLTSIACVPGPTSCSRTALRRLPHELLQDPRGIGGATGERDGK